jgi:hypothetical protein
MRILYRGHAKFLGELQERDGCTKTGKMFLSIHVPPTVLRETFEGVRQSMIRCFHASSDLVGGRSEHLFEL